jgi:multiple sugar transport system substrate-binding protein
VLNEDKTECTVDSPEAQEALQFMVDLIYKHEVSPKPGDLPEAANPFHTGRVAMRIDGSYSVRPTLEMDFDWGIAPLPAGKQEAAAYWTQAICMYNEGPNKDATWKFVEFLLSDEGQEIMAKTRLATPSKKSVAAGTAYAVPPPDGLQSFVQSYDFGRSLQFTKDWFAIMSRGESVLHQEFDKVFLNQQTVEAATERACEQIDKILAGE